MDTPATNGNRSAASYQDFIGNQDRAEHDNTLAEIFHGIDSLYDAILVCKRWCSVIGRMNVAISKHFCADSMNVGIYKLAPRIERMPTFGCKTIIDNNIRQRISASSTEYRFLIKCEVQTPNLDACAFIVFDCGYLRVEVEAEFRNNGITRQLSILCIRGNNDRYIFNNVLTISPPAQCLSDVFTLPILLKDDNGSYVITFDTLCNHWNTSQIKTLLTRDAREKRH